MSITPSSISLRTSSFPTSSIEFGAEAQEDVVAEVAATYVIVDVVLHVDNDRAEVVEVLVAIESRHV